MRTTLCFRLEVAEQPVGVLFINYRNFHPIAARQREHLRIIARLAAVVVDNAQRHHQTLEHQRRLAADATRRWLTMVDDEFGSMRSTNEPIPSATRPKRCMTSLGICQQHKLAWRQ